MEIRYECSCGNEVYDFTRNPGDAPLEARSLCDKCGRVYEVILREVSESLTSSI